MNTGPSLSPRAFCELIGHEAIVPEAYKDSVGVWTWGVGVTDASGHKVVRYKDKPQTLKRCLEVFLWLVETRYLPDVLRAFDGHELAEHELAAAVSFHYNTGAILHCSWVHLFLNGKEDAARASIMEWVHPASLTARRRKERDLFFNAKWSGDGAALVYEVAKPSYAPRKPARVPIEAIVQQMIGGR